MGKGMGEGVCRGSVMPATTAGVGTGGRRGAADATGGDEVPSAVAALSLLSLPSLCSSNWLSS